MIIASSLDFRCSYTSGRKESFDEGYIFSFSQKKGKTRCYNYFQEKFE